MAFKTLVPVSYSVSQKEKFIKRLIVFVILLLEKEKIVTASGCSNQADKNSNIMSVTIVIILL